MKRVESKESKSSKKMAKVEETVKEDEPFAKKKKIYKERSGYKYNSYLKELEISGYRDYRPDLIMVGPQFQATIDDQALYRGTHLMTQTKSNGCELYESNCRCVDNRKIDCI